MITEKHQASSAVTLGGCDDKLLRGFMRKLFGNKTLIHIVKEKVEKQITPGECFYEISDTGRVGRIYVSQYENVYIGTKCYCTISKTIESVLYNLRFLCNVDSVKVNNKTSSILTVEPSSIMISISSLKDKIVTFIHTLVTQFQMRGTLDLEEANEICKSPELVGVAFTAKLNEQKKKVEEEIEHEKTILELKLKVNGHHQRKVVLLQEIANGKVAVVSSQETTMKPEDELEFLNATISEEENYLQRQGRSLDPEYTRLIIELRTITDLIETRTNINERNRLNTEKALIEAQLKDMMPEVAAIAIKEKELERLKFLEKMTLDPTTRADTTGKSEVTRRTDGLGRVILSSGLEKTLPINRVRIPDALLEKIILKIEYNQDVTISISEIEEYIQSLGRKSDEFTCSINSSKGITIEEDVDSIIVRSSLVGESFTIPPSFKLVSVYDEVDVVRTISDFETPNVKRFDRTIQSSMLYLLFSQYGYDYYLYENLPPNSLERSEYLFKLYKMMIEWKKEVLIDPLSSDNSEDKEPLWYVSMLSDTDYNWKPLLELP